MIVKKGIDIFGESAFYEHPLLGWVTYRYDSFSGKDAFFYKDRYYFVLACDKNEEVLTDIENVILEIGG